MKLFIALLALTLSAAEPPTFKMSACDEASCIITIKGHEPVDVVKAAAEIAILKAQLGSAIADKEATEIQFQLQMQVCNSAELTMAKAKAVEARKQADAAKPKPQPAQPAKKDQP